MPTTPRSEDAFIEAFLTAYEDLSRADCDKDWVDRRIDNGVEMLATRKSDRETLAIELTVIEPFVNEKADFAFFEQAFLQIEKDMLSATQTAFQPGFGYLQAGLGTPARSADWRDVAFGDL